MTRDSMEFVVYMIHVCANRWNISPTKVYAKLTEAGCIQHYLVPHYEILHTQSSHYVAEDIRNYLTQRGVKI